MQIFNSASCHLIHFYNTCNFCFKSDERICDGVTCLSGNASSVENSMNKLTMLSEQHYKNHVYYELCELLVLLSSMEIVQMGRITSLIQAP